MRKVILYLAWIGMVLSLESCTKEKLDDCFFGLRLRFTFTLHTGDGNTDVCNLRAYVFDQDSILRAIGVGEGTHLADGSYAMNIRLNPGKYKIVIWGSSYADFFRSYDEGSLINPIHYESGIILGKTRLADFRTFLKWQQNAEAPETILPKVNEFDELYYGASGSRLSGSSVYTMEDVEIPEYQIVDKCIELIRNTSILEVSVKGLQNLRDGGETAVNPFEIYALGNNECYEWNNTIGEFAGKLKYSPYNITENGDQITFNVKVQRLEWSTRKGMPVTFYISDRVTGKVYYELNVVKTLLQAENPDGSYRYNDQEDLDREYIHPLALEFVKQGTDITVRIFINGWEIKNIHPVIR